MGSTVMASCGCGFHTGDLPIGGGMTTFQDLCSFPVFCEDCRAMRVANLLADPPACPDCHGRNVTPYDDARLVGRMGQAVVASWNVSARLGRTLVLTDGEYLCPACHTFGLRFARGSLLWD